MNECQALIRGPVDREALAQAHIHALAGACMVGGLLRTSTRPTLNVLHRPRACMSILPADQSCSDLGRELVLNQCLFSTSACSQRPSCMALGLRYAGTADADAAATLRELALRFLRLKSSAAGGKPVSKLIDRPTLEMCVGVAAVALGCVMVGRCRSTPG